MFKPGQIVENNLSNGAVIVCKVIEIINIDGEDMYRLSFANETGTSEDLIKNNKTWAAPAKNVRYHHDGCVFCG